MRARLRLLSVLLAAGGLAACTDRTPLAPDADFGVSGRGARQLTVMSRNLYIGADVDPVLQALFTPSPYDDLAALQQALGQLQRTDFGSRVWALADEIVRTKPDVVGLQEVYELAVIPAYLGLPGDPIDIDFLEALQYALLMRGANYVVAARNTLTNAVLASGAVTIVDHDVLLVDPARVTLVGTPIEQVFQHNLLDGVQDPPVEVLRGYVAHVAVVNGVPAFLLNSHTESGSGPDYELLRFAQASELAYVISQSPVPGVILTGDLNDVPGSPLYGVLAGAGLRDLWAALRPGVAGYSCCHAADLSNTLPMLDERIDYVWTMGLDGPSGRPQGQIGLTGNTPSALLAGAYGSIWPSDHAGVVATVLLPASLAH
jgi:endonuclease/exonuclease/phosphatase family metal-dependent hydrolase